MRRPVLSDLQRTRRAARARIVIDRSAPTAPLTTTISRATYNAFDAIATRRDLSKSELLRELVERFVAGERAKPRLLPVAAMSAEELRAVSARLGPPDDAPPANERERR